VSKKKEKEIPPSAQSVHITNESLNILPASYIISLEFKVSALFHRQCH